MDAFQRSEASTSFVGRAREVTDVTALLRQFAVVTLWGPGGVGKSRLAYEVARRAHRRGERVWVVSLGGRTGPSVIVRGLRDVGLDVRDDGAAGALERAADGAGGLVVVDECETELDQVADFIADVVRRMPGLRVLATSRRPLDLPGEHVYAVPRMSVGDAGSSALGADAVRLFLERQAGRRAPAASTEERGAIVEICRRLDGLPLAIELAARLSQAVGVEAVLARMDAGSLIHAPLGRDAPAQKRTIAATVDLSLTPLDEEARLAFPRLAVLAGTFDRDAARDVSRTGTRVERLLNRLVDHSLVLEDHPVGGRRRFRLLEPTRERALELLVGSGELDRVRKGHAQFFRSVIESADLPGPDDRAVMDRLDADFDNLRLALAWHHSQDASALPDLVARLTPFWARRGHLAEARRWLDVVLGNEGATSARLLTAHATILTLEGRFDEARPTAEAAVGAAVLEDDPAIEARAWASVAQLVAPDIEPARHAHARAKAAARRAGESSLLAGITAEHAGIEWAVGDPLLAVSLAHEVAHDRHDEASSSELIASTILARRALFCGDPDAATRWRDLAAASRSLRDPLLTSTCLSFLAFALARSGSTKGAATAMAEAGELVHRSGSPPARLQHAENAGLLLMRAGRPFLGLILVLAKERLAGPEWIDSRAYWQFVRTEVTRALAMVDADPRAEARLLAPEAAFERAIAAVEDVARTARDGSRTSTTRLSRRELEVAELVAAGLTNVEIARHLVISERTVEAHVRHVLDKLGLFNRTQVARWVLASAEPPVGTRPVRVSPDGGRASRR